MLEIIERYLSEREIQVRRSRAIGNMQDAAFGGAELFEALLITSLAVQTGAASQDDFQKLSKSVFRPFFRGLASAGKEVTGGVSEFAARSEESADLISKFQRFQTTIELAIRGETFSPERVYLSEPQAFSPYAADCLLMWSSIVQDEGFRNFRRAIETASEGEWSAMLKAKPTQSQILAIFDDPADKVSCLYFGFVRLAKYSSQLQEVTSAVSHDHRLQQKDAILFNRRLRDAFSWRVVMPSFRNNSRVDAIKERWIDLIREDDLGSAAQAEREFKQVLDQAFGMWYGSVDLE